MSTPRRDFMKSALALGALPAFLPEAMERAAQQTGAPPFQPDKGAVDFWNGFLRAQTLPVAKVPGRTRGGLSGMDREPFFFHYDKRGFVPAMEIPVTDLQPEGDVTVSLNIAALRPAVEDQATFERLQSAQLRLDVLQGVPIVDVLDTLAWTAVAVLHPGSNNKMPPIQNLSFDPATSWQKMQNIVLPKGQGRWAVNLYAQKKDGLFAQTVQALTKEVSRWAPVLGLPGISLTALQSFNAFYGIFHTRPEYLFQSNPVPIFGTQSALKASGSDRVLPLRTGTYVLVPMAHADKLTTDKLQTYELKQGLIVPKNTAAVDVYKAAGSLEPDVTYATIEAVVKPSQSSCAGKTTE